MTLDNQAKNPEHLDYIFETARIGRKSNINVSKDTKIRLEAQYKNDIPFIAYLKSMPKNSTAPRGRCKKLAH